MTAPTRDDFWKALKERFKVAALNGQEYVDIGAGDLHKAVGGYPGTDHRMPICSQVMRDAMQPKDQVLEEPPAGMGASLTIRYMLPR